WLSRGRSRSHSPEEVQGFKALALRSDRGKQPLPRHMTGRLTAQRCALLIAMFPTSNLCHRRSIAAEGFTRRSLPATLQRLVEAAFLVYQGGSASDAYWVEYTPGADEAPREASSQRAFREPLTRRESLQKEKAAFRGCASVLAPHQYGGV